MRPGTEDVPTAWRGLEDWLANTLNPKFRLEAKTIVDIGVDWGYSLWWWQSIFPNAKIYGVDPYGKTAEAWAGPDGKTALQHVEEWVKKTKGRVKLIKSASVEAADNWTGGPIDLLHIDGMHTYDAVEQDFWCWYPLVGKQRCIAFHDTISHYKTVGKFVAELQERRELGKFIYRTDKHHGMWVWQRDV